MADLKDIGLHILGGVMTGDPFAYAKFKLQEDRLKKQADLENKKLSDYVVPEMKEQPASIPLEPLKQGEIPVVENVPTGNYNLKNLGNATFAEIPYIQQALGAIKKEQAPDEPIDWKQIETDQGTEYQPVRTRISSGQPLPPSLKSKSKSRPFTKTMPDGKEYQWDNARGWVPVQGLGPSLKGRGGAAKVKDQSISIEDYLNRKYLNDNVISQEIGLNPDKLDEVYMNLTPPYRKQYDMIKNKAKQYVNELGPEGAVERALQEWQASHSGQTNQPGAQGQGNVDIQRILSQAQEAISQGAPREIVAKRLKEKYNIEMR